MVVYLKTSPLKWYKIKTPKLIRKTIPMKENNENKKINKIMSINVLLVSVTQR